MLSSPVFANSHRRSFPSPPPLCVLHERRLPRPGRGVKHSPPREICRFSTTTLAQPRQLPRRKLPISARFSAKAQNPLLCFQQLAHSSAIRWGWGVGADFRICNFEFRFSISSISFPFILFQTLLHCLKSQLLSFQAIPNSFAKTPGVGGIPTNHRTCSSPVSRHFPIQTFVPRTPIC